MTLLIVFNAYPERVGAYRTLLDPTSFSPLLAAGFYSALPWLSAWWGLAMGLAWVLVAFGRWTETLRWADLALDLFGVVVLCRLLFGAPLVLDLVRWDWPPEGRGALAGAWSLWSLDTLVRLGLVAGLLGLGVGAVRKLGQLLSGRTTKLGGTRS
jgi:hypothetical protein